MSRSTGRRVARPPSRKERSAEQTRAPRSAEPARTPRASRRGTPPPAAPREPAERSPAGRRGSALVALLLVALTATGLYLAGTSHTSTGTSSEGTEQVSLSERTTSCTGGIAGAQASTGVAPVRGVTAGRLGVGGRTAPRTVGLSTTVPLGTKPVRIVAGRTLAAGLFATQVARTKTSLSFVGCPEPRATWWFVGLGAGGQHDSLVTVANPRDGDAVVDVDVFGPKGPVAAPGLRGLSMGSGTSRTLDLEKLAPAAGDVAVRVTASRGLVSASAADSWAPDLVAKKVQEWATPQSGPTRRIELTGLPGKPDSATLLVANPGQNEAIAKLQVIGATGTFAPKDVPAITVAPGTVAAVPITSAFDGKPSALRLSSAEPLVASVRSAVGGDDSYAGAARPLAGSSVLGVPPDVAAEVRLSSLGKRATVTVESYDAKGTSLSRRTVSVPAATSVSAKVGGRARYVVLTATAREAVGALVISSAEGIGTTIAEPALQALRLPRVRPGS